MSGTGMSIATFKKIVPHLPTDISVMIKGRHGIGKSQLVKWLSKEIFKIPLIDRRLAQMSEGDMVGLPKEDGRVTRFLPMDWFMQACDSPKVLHLDEMNRATNEIMQAAFQIVLDRELNGHVLHPLTRVYASVNVGSEYNVNEIDPALLRRFFVVDLEPTVKEWLEFMIEKGISAYVIDFIRMNDMWLDPPSGKTANLSVQHQTRHSWERFDYSMKAFIESNGLDEHSFINDESLLFPLCRGFVGDLAATAFVGFVKTYDRQVSGKDVVESYKLVRKKVLSLGHERRNEVIERVSKYLSSLTERASDEQAENVSLFMRDIPAETAGEQRVYLWSKIISRGVSSISIIKPIIDKCKDSVVEVYKKSESLNEES